jgi:putative membrane-bound dehydrogenase-like protein
MTRIFSRLLVGGLLVCINSVSLVAQEALHLERLPAIPLHDAMQAIETQPGFAVELVASEPLVSSPVAIEFDSAGDLFVVEMIDYSEQEHEALGRVTRLRDMNHDGSMDEKEIILSDLSWPTAITKVGTEVWVATPPNLISATPASGLLSSPKTLLEGFGRQNVQGLANSFRWGLDSRMHLSTSSNGGLLTAPASSRIRVENAPRQVSGRDVAIDVATGSLYDVVGYGQHGMDFSPWGDRFVTSNSDHLQQVVAWYLPELTDALLSRGVAWRRSIAVDGPQAEVFRLSPVEPWRTLRTQMRLSGASIGLLEGGGRASGYFTSATGVTVYDGDQWPESMGMVAVVADVGSNLVHRKLLRPDKMAYKGERIDENTEFVRSKDTWFRPVQFTHGPDGCLYIVDMARETIEHPKSLPETIKSQLDLTSGRNLGRIWRIKATGRSIRRDGPGLDQAETADLIETLSHPNGWHRETASLRLVLGQDPQGIPPLRAMAASHPSPFARLHALSVLAAIPGGMDSASWMDLLKDAHPKVRLWALILLPRFMDAIPDSDRQQGLRQLSDEQDLEVRMVACVRSRSLVKDPEQRVGLIAAWIRNDWECEELRAAVEYAIQGEAARYFADRLLANASSDILYRDAIQGWWDAALFQLHQARQLPDWIEQPFERNSYSVLKAPWLVSLSRLVHRRQITDPNARQGVERLVKKFVLPVTYKENISQDTLRLLAILPTEERRIKLQQILDDGATVEIQQAAIEFWTANDPSLQAMLMDRWEGLPPPVRQTMLQQLVRNVSGARLLLNRIETGPLEPKQIPAWVWQSLRGLGQDDIQRRVAQWAPAVLTSWEQEAAPYREAWKQPGDAAIGEANFRKWCAACHRVNGIGIELAPSLESYRVRPNEAIAMSIAEPSRDMDPKYEQHQVRTDDEEVVSGLLTAQGADFIEITTAQNALVRIPRTSIETWTTTGKSLMPEGMLQELGPQGLNDLIAFLRSKP